MEGLELGGDEPWKTMGKRGENDGKLVNHGGLQVEFTWKELRLVIRLEMDLLSDCSEKFGHHFLNQEPQNCCLCVFILLTNIRVHRSC